MYMFIICCTFSFIHIYIQLEEVKKYINLFIHQDRQFDGVMMMVKSNRQFYIVLVLVRIYVYKCICMRIFIFTESHDIHNIIGKE